MMPRTG